MKSPEKVYELIEEMAANSREWASERQSTKKTAGIYTIDVFTALAVQMEALNKNLRGLQLQKSTVATAICDSFGGGHSN